MGSGIELSGMGGYGHGRYPYGYGRYPPGYLRLGNNKNNQLNQLFDGYSQVMERVFSRIEVSGIEQVRVAQKSRVSGRYPVWQIPVRVWQIPARVFEVR